ncbi:DNA polymerase III subunit gamma/tau [Rhodovarius lipocyclicus]|uniref:DNA polymerase III subunit gamma/tau n=1 Tax=Rhodovarius lipocyclicus TaxID=268410 RepID=UPI001F1E1410|nr:DNA polymerase III subunit gamma/tau [Rhodovarius lipocyclicus]
MTSDMFGADAPEPTADTIPEPPAPEGPGLFGMDDPPPPAAAPPPPAPTPVPAAAPAAAPGPAADAQPYRVLARKYRPRDFSELVGQDALVRTLRNAFATGRVAHAFMLTGVRGVGKTTTARIIARALNCIGVDGKGGPTPEPCGVCANCTAILADRHPDVMELDAASNNGVDDVRELREAVRYRPAQARFKIYILDEVHMLSNAAFNALLKTLEEPPPAVKFIFATTELRKVPATILSRCQTFHLPRVPQATLRAHYANICGKEGVAAEEEALSIIARAADGSVRDGLSLLDQAIALSAGAVTGETVREMLGLADRTLVLDALEAALTGDMPALIGHLDRAHERGAEPGVVLADMLELTHTLTRLHTVPGLAQDLSLPEHERSRGADLAAKLTLPVLGRAWQILLKGVSEIAEAPDRRAALEMVLIRLAHVADMPTPGDLVRRLTEGGMPPVAARPGPSGSGGGPTLRALTGGGAALAMPEPEPEPGPSFAPQPTTWQEVVALAAEPDPTLHAQLRFEVHPVSLAPGRLEIHPRPTAPRDLAGRLSLLLEKATGTRWVVGISREAGAATLGEQGKAAEADRFATARAHPFVQAILEAFPGAEVQNVRDIHADAYGLTAPALLAASAMPDDLRDFAPPDAMPAYDDDEAPSDED